MEWRHRCILMVYDKLSYYLTWLLFITPQFFWQALEAISVMTGHMKTKLSSMLIVHIILNSNDRRVKAIQVSFMQMETLL